MNVWLTVFGVIFLIAAGGFFWAYLKQKRELALMQATETMAAAEIANVAPGTTVEAKGWLRCAAPISGKYCDAVCAHSAASLDRDYIEYDYEDGKRKRQRRSERVETHVNFAPFFLEDTSGRVAVNAEGADVEGVTVVERWEPFSEEMSGAGLLRSALKVLTVTEETLGFRYREVHLPLDIEIYVLGAKTADGAIGAPDRGSFIISNKSEEERAADAMLFARWMLIVASIGLVLGLVCLGAAYWVGETPPSASESAPASATP